MPVVLGVSSGLACCFRFWLLLCLGVTVGAGCCGCCGLCDADFGLGCISDVMVFLMVIIADDDVCFSFVVLMGCLCWCFGLFVLGC